MKTDTSEYLSTQEQDQTDRSDAKKKDSDQQKIFRARREVQEDPELTDGARNLFTYLLDLAFNPAVNNGRRGQISISTTQLSERLCRSHRAIYGWVNQLQTQRHIWVSKLRRPNMNAMNVYHITQLQPRKELSLELAGEPLWGDGYRRPVQEMPKGARGATCKKKHVLFDQFGRPVFSQPAQNQPATRKEVQVGPANFAGGTGKECYGDPQNLREQTEDFACASRKKQQVPPAKSDTTQWQEPALLRESKDVSRRSLESSNNVYRGNAFKKGGETGFLIRVAEVMARYSPKFAEKEMTDSRGWWISKFRQDDDKACRVLSEIDRMIKEQVGFSKNPGAAAVDLWERFA